MFCVQGAACWALSSMHSWWLEPWLQHIATRSEVKRSWGHFGNRAVNVLDWAALLSRKLHDVILIWAIFASMMLMFLSVSWVHLCMLRQIMSIARDGEGTLERVFLDGALDGDCALCGAFCGAKIRYQSWSNAQSHWDPLGQWRNMEKLPPHRLDNWIPWHTTGTPFLVIPS